MNWIKFLLSIRRPTNIVVDNKSTLIFRIPSHLSLADVEYAYKSLKEYFPDQKILVIHGFDFVGVVKNEN